MDELSLLRIARMKWQLLVLLVCVQMAPQYAEPLNCTYQTRGNITLDKTRTLQVGGSISLLSSILLTNASACAQACCDKVECTVALVKTDQKHCFLLNCHPSEKCMWMQTGNFTSIITKHTTSSSTTGTTTSTTSSSTTGTTNTATTHSADISSSEDMRTLEQLLTGASTDGSTQSDNDTTPGATRATLGTGFGGLDAGNTTTNLQTDSLVDSSDVTHVADDATTTLPISDISTTGNGTYNSSITKSPGRDLNQTMQTLLDLVGWYNLTTPSDNVNETSQNVNKLLAKLIQKTGLTNLTENGAAITVAKLTDDDLAKLVEALQQKVNVEKKTLDAKTAEVIETLAKNASIDLPAEVGNMTRDQMNRVVAKLIRKSGSTNLTEDGATRTVSQLTSKDLQELVESLENVGNKTETGSLDRDRGDPTTDQSANVSVEVVKGSGEGSANAMEHSPATSDGLTNSGSSNATLITTLTIGCIFTVLAFVFVGKRFYDGWERRHYNKIDHLINGIYQ